MKKLFRPAALLFYLIVIPITFLLGVGYVMLSGSAEGQGLAGGAIVFMTGLFFAIGGLLLAIFLVPKMETGTIIRVNKIFGLILFLASFLVSYRIWTKEELKKDVPAPQKHTVPAAEKAQASLTKWEMEKSIEPSIEKEIASSAMTMGVFQFDLQNLPKTHYFYSLEAKDLGAQLDYKVDSLTFDYTDYGDPIIKTAPPWFVPYHSKMDYGFLIQRVLRVAPGHLTIIGNEKTGQKHIVSRSAGQFMYWPDFFMSVFAVDLLTDHPQDIHVKPFDESGKTSQNYDYLHAYEAEGQWLHVRLMQGAEIKGHGWIRWTDGQRILIGYSLLS